MRRYTQVCCLARTSQRSCHSNTEESWSYWKQRPELQTISNISVASNLLEFVISQLLHYHMQPDRAKPCRAACDNAKVNGVLMASAVAVLKHETSILLQRHNFISIDFKFSVRDSVREVTSPAKFGSDPMSGRDATRGQHIYGSWLFFISQQSYSPYPWTNFRAQ